MEPEMSSAAPKKSHKLLWIILTIVLLLILGGVIGYVVDQKNKQEKKDQAKASAQTAQANANAAKNQLAAADNSGLPYTATITSTLSGAPKTATMVSDGKGNYSYTYQADGKTVSTVYTKDTFYLCNDASMSSCVKYALTDKAAKAFDPSTYQYDATKIDSLKSSAAYKGQEPCPGGTGTCDVWQTTSESGGTTTKLYIDASSKRILKATYSIGTTSSDITYEYKNVEVKVPTNATEAPAAP